MKGLDWVHGFLPAFPAHFKIRLEKLISNTIKESK